MVFQVRVLDILKRVGPQMQERLRKAMFHVAWSPDSLPTQEAVDRLFEYLHAHLKTLNYLLLPQNFQKVLGEVRVVLSSDLSAKFSQIHNLCVILQRTFLPQFQQYVSRYGSTH